MGGCRILAGSTLVASILVPLASASPSAAGDPDDAPALPVQVIEMDHDLLVGRNLDNVLWVGGRLALETNPDEAAIFYLALASRPTPNCNGYSHAVLFGNVPAERGPGQEPRVALARVNSCEQEEWVFIDEVLFERRGQRYLAAVPPAEVPESTEHLFVQGQRAVGAGQSPLVTDVTKSDPVPESLTECRGEPITIPGSYFNDNITGSPNRDVIRVYKGNDKVDGAGGNDLICLDDGKDIGKGGEGNDTVHGDNGPDRIDGGPQDDTLFGGKGNDTGLGGSGSDRLRGEAGDDDLRGGTQFDKLFGGPGADKLDGGGHDNDLCDGGADQDADTAANCEQLDNIP